MNKLAEKYMRKVLIRYFSRQIPLDDVIQLMEPDTDEETIIRKVWSDLQAERNRESPPNEISRSNIVETPYTPPELRDYQVETVRDVKEALAVGDRCFVQLPTGAGKTRVMYKLIDDDFESQTKLNSLNGRLEPQDKPTGIVYICMSPRIDLAKQHFSPDNARNLKTKFRLIHMHSKEPEVNINRVIREWNRQEEALIITALYQSVSRLRGWLDRRGLTNLVRLVFSDEAHLIARWCQPKVLDKEPDINWFMSGVGPHAKYINLSATPTENQVQNVGDLWGPVIKRVTVGDLIGRGILCPIETLIPNIRVIQTVDSRGNSQNTLDTRSMCEILYKAIVYTNAQKAIVFCNTTAKCRELRDLFEQEASRAESGDVRIQPFIHVSGGVDSEFTEEDFDIMDVRYNDGGDGEDGVSDKARGEIVLFEKYNKGPAVVFTCKRISMGYDFPAIDFVGFCDPKCSRAELAQCIGRGLRISPGKTTCKVFIPITPADYEQDTGLKRRHLTLFEYLNYLRDEVGFEYRIKDCGDLRVKPKGECGGGSGSPGDRLEAPVGIEPAKICEIPGSGYNFIDRDRICLILAKECIRGKQNGKRDSDDIGNNIIIQLLRSNNIDSPEKYTELRDSRPELQEMIPADYKNLGSVKWKDVIDPDGVKYYQTIVECRDAISKVYIGFQTKYLSRNMSLDEYRTISTKLRETPSTYNQYDNKIPLFEPEVFY